MKRLTDLNGKWVLVTGAAGGIGLATAKAFARRGAQIVITDINQALLQTARAEIAALGVLCHAHHCDVADAAAVNACAALVQEQVGTIDVLVNNAGIAFLGNFAETPPLEWQRILQVNVMGVVHCVLAFLPAMRSAGGPRHIVNVASTAAFLPAPNMAAYAASKGAVKQLSEVLAMELADTNVTVQAVYPGIINTAIVGGIKSTGPSFGAAQLATLQQYYLKQGCDPAVVGEDIVNGVLARRQHILSGPMAWLGNLVARLSPGLARSVTLKAARSNGYLPKVSP